MVPHTRREEGGKSPLPPRRLGQRLRELQPQTNVPHLAQLEDDTLVPHILHLPRRLRHNLQLPPPGVSPSPSPQNPD